MSRKWLKTLVAVVLGNALYFFGLVPYLPPAGRHHPNRLDWGLLVDFWVCLAMYGLVDLSSRKLQGKTRS